MYAQIELTKHQHLFWAGQQLFPDVPLYNTPFAWVIEGLLEPTLFQQAFEKVVEQSDALRTVVGITESGRPDPRVLNKISHPLTMVDLSLRDDPDLAIDKWIKNRCEQPLDMENQLFDAALIRLGEHKHVWFLNQHHLISDGWSASLIFRRCGELYGVAQQGTLSQVEKWPQFRDVTQLESRYRTSDQHQKDHDYWVSKIQNAVPPVHFYGKPPLREQSPVKRVSIHLAQEQTNRLKTLSAEVGIRDVTTDMEIFNVLAALTFALLYRVSGNRDLSIGTPIQNRPSAKLQKTIGLLMEVTVLRINVQHDESFTSLMEQIRKEKRKAIRHCRYTVGNPTHRRNYNTILTLHNYSFENFHEFPTKHTWQFPGYWNNNEHLAIQVNNFNNADGFSIDLDMHTGLFNSFQQKQLTEHLQILLKAILENPHAKIDQAQLLTPFEQEFINSQVNDTYAPLPKELTIPSQFVCQVNRTPHQPAIAFLGDEMSYQQLNQAANRLANHLIKSNISKGTLVGLCLDRSLEMVVGMLGIHKAGAGFVPIDPKYPTERILYMLDDSKVPLLLTQEKYLGMVADHPAKKILLNLQSPELLDESNTDPDISIDEWSTAYVIYTSGSTGKPKGVKINHHALINFLASMAREPGIHQEDKLLAVTTICFDIANLEIFLPLVSGAQVILADEETAKNGLELRDFLNSNPISIMQATPATWEMLFSAGWSGNPKLKVLCGGEPLPMDLAQRLLACNGELWNLYGPTETTIWSTCRKIIPSDDRISIGKPIDNTQLYLLDNHFNKVPVGMTGELFIGGDGVADGYLNRPELNKERFLPTPFEKFGKGYLYRTGDSAQFSADGNLNFLGRLDNQTKIRGFRIELGEIETVLQKNFLVRQCVVHPFKDPQGHNQLVGFVIPHTTIPSTDKETDKPSGVTLLRYLREHLPDYMVPARITFLTAFPLTPNGKIDRKKLPEPIWDTLPRETSSVPPHTPTEKNLAKILQEILNLQEIGVHDDFFELGGDSLAVVQLLASIEKKFEIKLSLTVLERGANISKIAQKLDSLLLHTQNATSSSQLPSCLLSITEGELDQPIFFIPPAATTSVGFLQLARRLSPDFTTFGLQYPGMEDGDPPLDSVEKIADRFLADILRAQPEGEYVLGGRCFGGLVAYEIAHKLLKSGRPVKALLLMDTTLWKQGPMVLARQEFKQNNLASKGREIMRALQAIIRKLYYLQSRFRKNSSNDRLEAIGRTGLGWLREDFSVRLAIQRWLLNFSREGRKIRKIWDSNLTAGDSFTPKPSSANIIFFMNDHRTHNLQEKSQWYKLIGKQADYRVVNGTDHVTLFEEPFVQDLAHQIKEVIGRK
ncbi:MAG: amino acid adenylation domain-containing protein [Magnetococcales bacterium]|nr:amino acid adenylation domain-containing protein [Magnetococcales bacterium]